MCLANKAECEHKCYTCTFWLHIFAVLIVVPIYALAYGSRRAYFFVDLWK